MCISKREEVKFSEEVIIIKNILVKIVFFVYEKREKISKIVFLKIIYILILIFFDKLWMKGNN